MMDSRIQIDFRDRDHDRDLLELARREASRLVRQDSRITGCQVVIGYSRDHGPGVGGTTIKVLFSVPGCTLVVRHAPSGPWEEDQPASSIVEAFESAIHMLDSYTGRQRPRQQTHSVFPQIV